MSLDHAIEFFLDRYQGMVHGDDAEGNVDVEFPNMHAATGFISAMVGNMGGPDNTRALINIRQGDVVTSVWSPVVLTVRKAEKS